MKQIAPLTLCLMLATAPAFAQDEPVPDGDIDEGFSLLEEGAQLLLRGLMDEMEPSLDELGDLAEDMAREMEPALRLLTDEMGEALTTLMARIDDITYYEMPEILENGDVIIRRKPDAPPYVPTEPEDDAPQGEVDL